MRKALHTLAFVAGLALAAPAAASGERPADTHFFDASFGDLKEELALARKEGKKGLFLMYAAEDCSPCIRMKATILNQARVQDHFRRHFRVLHIDFNGDTEVTDFEGRAMRAKDFAQKVARVIGTPTFAVIGLDGRELLRFYGPTRDVEEFMLFADYIVAGEYRSRPFDAYRRERLARR